MGIAIPQVITSDRASGAQVIDGSLKFDASKSQYLKRTFSAGNRRTSTWSGWVQRASSSASNKHVIFGADGGSDTTRTWMVGYDNSTDDTLRFEDDFSNGDITGKTNAVFRNFSGGWYHVVVALDTTQAAIGDGLKIYVNGELQTLQNTSWNQNQDTNINSAVEHKLGIETTAGTRYFDGKLAQVYFIDGQALGPEYFGFTDPLTNTWRPKKFNQFTDSISTQYSGASTLTWDDSPIGSIYTLSNGNKTATAGGGGSGYPNADVWSIAIPADSTYAWTLDITNGDSTGGWYFTDSQTASGTHADERGGNSLGMRPGETHAGCYGTFASANGFGSDPGQDKISMPGASPGPGFARVDFVVYRPASGTGKVWVKNNSSSSWVGGGDPSNTSSTPSFIIPDGTTYFGLTFYDRQSNGDQIATFDGDGSIQQKIGGNSFYLPMDGNSPIGQDKSGNGNDWTPVNFGGSVALDSPQVSGARPILNTLPGGTQAGVGVFGSKQNVGYAVTVYDDGGGNKYYIDGVKQATLTGLIRGATYTFDTSDSTVSSHPFRFSESDGGSEYTNGVAAITGTATTITIPYNSSNELYYYCTSHSGMGSSITGITTNEKLADQYASHCTLALPLVGSTNDTCASIACTSTTKSVTSNGNAAAASEASNFYAGSFEFDGSGDYLVVTNTSDLVFEEGTFTIECWMYAQTYNSITYPTVISKYDNGDASWILRLKSDGDIIWYAGQVSGGTNNESTTQPINLNQWHHLAVVREGTGSNQTKVYVDGILQLICSDSSDYDDTNNIYIGRQDSSNANEFDGYIQDVRIYKGITKYTASTVGDQAFVVPSTNPDILPDTPSGVSGSSKLTKITDGTVSFDGSGDSLKVPDSSDLAFGTGEFTVEMFFYSNTASGNDVLYDSRASTGSPTDGFSIVRNNDQLRTYTSGEYKITPSTFRVASNRWYHLAITRESTTQKMYIDGELVGSATVSNDFSQSKATIGSDVNKSENWDGFISNVRLIKGTALYTSNFTPPSAPLTNVTNTKLLCCQSNSEGPQKTAVIPSVTGTATAMWPLNSDINDDSGNSNNLSENGGSTSFTSAGTNPFGLSNCADFAADGKYLSYTVDPASAWTIDGYIKFDDVSSGSNSYVLGWNGTNGNDTTIGLTKSNSTFTVWGSSNLSTTTVAETGRWYHVRLTTNSASDLALYVDGVLAGRSTSSDGSPASPITIGDMQSGRFNGQIAGVRYTPTDLGAPPLGGETTSSGVTSNSPSAGVGLAGDVAATNFNPFNTNINAIRGQETGYCTANQLDKGALDLSNGNLRVERTSDTTDWETGRCTFRIPDTGRWYWEMTLSAGSNDGIYTGVGLQSAVLSQEITGFWGYNSAGYAIYNTGYASSRPSMSVGDTACVSFDRDNNKMWVLINGATTVYEGNPYSGTDPNSNWRSIPSDVYPVVGARSTGVGDYNFGQKPFKFPPPDGFQPINAANLRPETVIPRPDQYVGVKTFSIPNGGSGGSVTLNNDFDMVWTKNRSNSSTNHVLQDSVRGYGDNKNLHPNLTVAQTSTQNITAVNGRTLTIGSNTNYYDNNVAWSWNAGGAPTATNTQTSGAMTANSVSLDGVLQSAYTPAGSPSKYPKKMSIGTKQGFSIVQFEGTGANATVPHGLGKPAKFMIVKNMDEATGWGVYHDAIGTATDNYIELQSDAAASADDTAFQDTAPTSDVFSVGSKAAVNDTDDDSIAYIWADVPGLQKFGSYTGNGSADGPFIELGFRPAVLITKRYDGGNNNWQLVDAERSPFNVANTIVKPDQNAAESSHADYAVDFLSNGFKHRTGHIARNGDGNTYLYAAWAEAPAVDLYGGGANAR